VKATIPAITPKVESEIKNVAKINSGSKGDSRMIKAWEILHNSDLVTDPARLKSLFDKLGVQEASDLKLLEHSSLLEISQVLKPIPKNKFLQAMTTG